MATTDDLVCRTNLLLHQRQSQSIEAILVSSLISTIAWCVWPLSSWEARVLDPTTRVNIMMTLKKCCCGTPSKDERCHDHSFYGNQLVLRWPESYECTWWQNDVWDECCDSNCLFCWLHVPGNPLSWIQSCHGIQTFSARSNISMTSGGRPPGISIFSTLCAPDEEVTDISKTWQQLNFKMVSIKIVSIKWWVSNGEFGED